MGPTISADHVPGHPDFRRVADIPGVRVELRYASTNNLAGRDLYSPLDCGWLHRDGAEALAASAAWLARNQHGKSLLVLDAMRPQRVQEALWKSLEGTELRRYFADPVRGSIHSFGMAVDITVADAQGRELDMGTPFDCLDERSHPALEEGFVAAGVLGVRQIENRLLLRAAMRHGGWHGISTEWWHFDCGDRAKVRAEYARIV